MSRILTMTALSLGAALVACAPAVQQSVTTTPVPAAVTTPPTVVPAVTYKPMTPLSATPVRSFTQAAQVTDPKKNYRAVLKTSKGDITLDLYVKASPVAVNNFVFLALNHFYDGTRFHRVIEGFMAQGGDPLSANPAQRGLWGTGGPGYQFSAEVMNGLRFDQAGVLGMARSASLNSQGSQFFITVAPADFLSGSYTVFGRVVAGQDVLSKLTRNYTGSGPIAGAEADVLSGVDILEQQ